MIDWCVSCADAGCILAGHRDMKHRAFAYIFIRIMKDIIEKGDYFYQFKNLDGTETNIWHLDEKFYKELVENEVVGQFIGKRWFKPSYWKFMQHIIEESELKLIRGMYDFKVQIFKHKDDKIYGSVNFLFGKKREFLKMDEVMKKAKEK